MAIEPTEDILRKTRALLDLAARAGTPAEAEAAMAKAANWMEKYNISSATLEKREGRDAKRKQEMVLGGVKAWQREMWGSVARLNFCMHWVQDYVRERPKNTFRPDRQSLLITSSRHVVVGRTVNVEATKAMAGYLEQTINRLLRERLTDSAGSFNWQDYNGRFGASFREGAADAIMSKLSDRRRKVLAAEERRKRAGEADASSGTDLSLSVFIDQETDANLDFIHGTGYSARRAQQQMENAAERKREQDAHTAWAAANPEEAARKAEEARKRARRSGGYGRSPREREKDWGAYQAGSKAGEKVSLDKQAEGPSNLGKISGPKAIHL